jgi:glutathione S-transferase
MITVWGRDTSSNVQIVVWALNELGIQYERINAGGKYGRSDTEEYRRMNPNRLVPVLQDGDLTLWESAAIVRYLGARYGDEQFWPADPGKRAQVDKWAEWIKTTFGPSFITGIFWPMIGTPSEHRDSAAIARGVEKMKGVALILDERLADGPYLGGDDVCFADIVVGTLLYRYFTLDFDRADTPNLRAYYDRLVERPAYARHVMISYESLRAK